MDSGMNDCSSEKCWAQKFLDERGKAVVSGVPRTSSGNVG